MPVVRAEDASVQNQPDFAAASIDIDHAGPIVAAVANRGVAVTAPFVVEVELDGRLDFGR